MTLFTMLLVLIAERLFKLGEHWQLDHRLEVLFRRVKHYSMLRTLLMAVVAMLVAFLILQALEGLFFNVPLLVVWILLGLLCIGAGKVRLHYHAYLKAAARNDSHAQNAMANELTLIHGIPPGCNEREYLCELQNALLWINFRYYLAPLFWFIVGGIWGPVTLVGYSFLRAWQSWLARFQTPNERQPVRNRRDFTRAGLDPGAPGGRGLCVDRPWRKGTASMVCLADRPAFFAISCTNVSCAVLAGPRAAYG